MCIYWSDFSKILRTCNRSFLLKFVVAVVSRNNGWINKDKMSPAHIAVENENLPALRECLSGYVDINEEYNGLTLLHHAIDAEGDGRANGRAVARRSRRRICWLGVLIHFVCQRTTSRVRPTIWLASMRSRVGAGGSSEEGGEEVIVTSSPAGVFKRCGCRDEAGRRHRGAGSDGNSGAGGSVSRWGCSAT